MDTINTKLHKYIKKLHNSTDSTKSKYYRKKIQYYRHMKFNKHTQSGMSNKMSGQSLVCASGPTPCGPLPDSVQGHVGGDIQADIIVKRKQVIDNINKLEEPYKKCSSELEKLKQAVRIHLSDKDAEILKLKKEIVESSALLSESEEKLKSMRVNEDDFLNNVLEITITNKPSTN